MIFPNRCVISSAICSSPYRKTSVYSELLQIYWPLWPFVDFHHSLSTNNRQFNKSFFGSDSRHRCRYKSSCVREKCEHFYPLSSCVFKLCTLNLKRAKTSINFTHSRRSMAEGASASVGSNKQQKQNFDYLLILDFEATCDDKTKLKPQEIIEFPVLKLNVQTLHVESTFHQYVLPQYHPELTPFCTELTGIVQDMVDGQPHFPEVFQSFHEWMNSEGLLDPTVKSAFVTCGDWDLKSMLPRQCAPLNLGVRPYFRTWINIKRSYADMTTRFPKGMMTMLTELQLKHVGRHHSGIDDCTNIANIAVELIRRGYVFKVNGQL